MEATTIIQSGAVLLAGASAYASWRAARASERQAQIAEQARKEHQRWIAESSKPEIVVDAVYHAEHAIVRVRNIGQGAARDITFSANSDSLPSTLTNFDVLKSKMFTQGISYIAPKEDRHTAWTGLIGLQQVWRDSWGDSGIEITATYWNDDRTQRYFKVSEINPLVDMDVMDITTPDMMRRAAFEKALPELVKYIKNKEMAQRYWAWRNRSWALEPVAKVRRMVEAKRGK